MIGRGFSQLAGFALNTVADRRPIRRQMAVGDENFIFIYKK